MKHDPKATANALALLGAAAYAICAVWSVTSRSSFMSFFGQWSHSINLAALPTAEPNLAGIVTGLITFSIASWLAGYLFARLYNAFAQKK